MINLLISFFFKPWLHTASMMLIIFLLLGNGDYPLLTVQAAGADSPTQPPTAAPTASQTNSISSQGIGGVANELPSTIFFNQTKTLKCNASEKTPGYITTPFMNNPPFVFGCLSELASTYYFSVTLLGPNFPNTPVWLANRYNPLKENASLSVTPQGSLLLQDSNGTHVWSSSGPDASNSAGLRLTSEGNLILFDYQNNPLWESFSEPVDLLVPGQFLNPGSMLVAGFSSHVVPTGNFSAVMEQGGVIFYENSSSQGLPYYALRYPLIPGTTYEILDSPCNDTQLQLTKTNLTQVQLSYIPSCKTPVVSSPSELAVSFDSPVLFIRLEPNGVVRGYYPDHAPSYDVFHNTSKGPCGIPNACGPYGICEELSECVCPGNQSSADFFTESSSTEYLLTSISCSLKEPLTCQEGDTEHHLFLDIERVDYFANDYISATMITESLDLCRAACSANCSCLAAFYRKGTKQCYLHETVLSMIRVPNEDYVGSIKLQRQTSISNKSELRLIVGISIASAISILLFGVWYYYHKGKRGMHTPLTKDDDELLFSLPGQPKRYSFRELQAATWEFSQKLGVGGFGSVYKGLTGDGSSVAVKQLESTTRFTQGMKEFRNEVVALSNINHQNLVHLKGFCADGGHRLLVYEYVSNGSLDTWLFRKGKERPGPTLDWKTRLAIAVHTARGLVFLHEQCRNRIVHLDIKPQNILLDENFIPKLSDFGLSRLINEDQDSAVSRMRGTPGYMAPECLILTDATEKSDVYSFGMVLLEIVSGRKNVDISRLAVHGDTEGWYFPAMAARKLNEGNVVDIIDNSLGKLSKDDMTEATRVIKIAFWCIQDDPSLRPTMGNALLMLEGYCKVAQPPLAFHFGMRFHLTNSMSSNSHTSRSAVPQNNIEKPKCLENGDQHYHQDDDGRKDQGEQESSMELTSPTRSYASPVSSHQASPLRSPHHSRFLSQQSFPNSALRQASPHHSPPPHMLSHRSSPISSPRQESPHHHSHLSSPHRALPLPSSPLSQNTPPPLCDTRPQSRQTSPLGSSCPSPKSSRVSIIQHV